MSRERVGVGVDLRVADGFAEITFAVDGDKYNKVVVTVALEKENDTDMFYSLMQQLPGMFMEAIVEFTDEIK